MLGNFNAVANIAVKNLGIARRFYEDTLGLSPADTDCEDLIAYRSGNTRINVYQSSYAGTNQATAVTWALGGDIERIVSALKEKGVRFEHYDMPGTKLEGDVHVMDKMKVAWFKDPDGNILNLTDD
ncbi:catechol 2,3-dioxygenase-like lactoylglutathione lyase family enzyme [Variovorax paradoxus]|jgi:catechol 2,3-dioxygenase-like lactoylglutathione lyase family enzyme|uniref:VOC family protein n=1 Tax=Variovorax paradoxus TaxID=34073 RepID=UPI00278939E1|nr:VOC family protein [Variovorax paradoxus]MDP9931380.1 catechol 2,3-dioxygenase-like lactoylglutathione lyase family enzyme [Variovorax paradoxus]MDQ0027956.1 catechol 2,3-dioxygenase-like lactoylglutathione lyase family enzyme [Variovorax paradoxus]